MQYLRGGFGIDEYWIRKGLKEFIADNTLFANTRLEKAQMLLEIGTHKIKDLKDWLIAANILNNTQNTFIVSAIGEIFYKYDREFSEDGTFWIIHNYLSLSEESMWNYYWYVNEFKDDKFNREDFHQAILNQTGMSNKTVRTFLVQPLLQTMRKTRLGKSFGIMTEDAPNQFRRIEPPEDKLDPIIVAYITMDWVKRNDRSSANLIELTTLKCSPGKVLHLSSRRFSEYLDKIQAMFNKEILWVSYTAGLNSVSFEKGVNPLDILKAYYIKKRDEISPLDAYRKAREEK